VLSVLKNHVSGISKNLKFFTHKKNLKLNTHTHEYSECTVKSSEENSLYFELYKKRQISDINLSIYTATNLLIFCSSKYNEISTGTSHDYSGHVYAFME
jgi:hypothetical protein